MRQWKPMTDFRKIVTDFKTIVYYDKTIFDESVSAHLNDNWSIINVTAESTPYGTIMYVAFLFKKVAV